MRKSRRQKVVPELSSAVMLRRVRAILVETAETMDDCMVKHAQLVRAAVGIIDVVENAGGVVSSRSAETIDLASPVDGPALAAAYLQACHALGLTSKHYRKK